jgi:hypothetical protein
VWHNATRLLETKESTEQARLIQQVEEETLRLGSVIGLKGARTARSGFV